METTWQMLAVVCPLVFLASAMDAVAGGGGLISLPAYYLAGLPPVWAAGSNKLSASFGTLIAAIKYAKSGSVRWKTALCAVPGALIGAWLGAEALKRAPETIVRVCLLVVVPAMAVVMLLKKSAPDSLREGDIKGGRETVLCMLIGLGTGFYDGFFGPGTGMILILLFTLVLKIPAVAASGSAKIVNLASNIAALASFASGRSVLWTLALPAMLCSAAGGYFGSSMAVKVGEKLVRSVMFAVMALLLVKIAADVLFA